MPIFLQLLAYITISIAKLKAGRTPVECVAKRDLFRRHFGVEIFEPFVLNTHIFKLERLKSALKK